MKKLILLSLCLILYIVVQAAPTIIGISPTSGPTTGGTSVIITGTNFTGAITVKFGVTNAINFTVNSATQITATSPAGSAGTVDITVATRGITSTTSLVDQFTYTPTSFILNDCPDCITTVATQKTKATTINYHPLLKIANNSLTSTLELTTPFSSNNGQKGVMFDILASKNIYISQIGTNLANNISYNLEIYYKKGTYVGFENDASAWTKIGSATNVASNGLNVETIIPIDINLSIAAGERCAFYVTSVDIDKSIKYTDGTSVGAELASNSDLAIYTGIGRDYPFGTIYTPRSFNGVIHYNLGPEHTVSVTAVTDTKAYDGTTASNRKPIVGALAAGDAINIEPIQAFDNANVGSTHILSASGLTIKNASNVDVTSNYTITYVASPATGVILGAPSFTSTPITTVGYDQTYNYNVAATTEGSLATTITAPTLPAWLTLSAGVAKSIGNIPAGEQIRGVTGDNEGNTYAMSSSTIYKITPDGTTTVWRSGLITGLVNNLLIVNGYMYIPREGDAVNSLTRIPIANPNSTEELFVTLIGGAHSLTYKDGWIYASIYNQAKIVRIKESTRAIEDVLTSADGIPTYGPLGLSFDQNGNLFIATYDNNSILKYNGSTLTPVLSNLSDQTISVKVDVQGNFFVGLRGGGLRKYKPDFSSYDLVSLNANDDVWAVSMTETAAITYSILNTNLVYRIDAGISIKGTPAKSDVGPHNVVLRATNTAGYTDQTFTVNVVDNVAPVVTAFSPVTNATDISLQPTLSITFDEEVSLGSTGVLSIYNGASLVKSYDLSVVADKALFTLSSDKKSVSITLTENLPVNTVLSVGLGAGFVKDKYDNNFAGFTAASNTWQFTTVNKVAQTITYPAIDAKTYGDADFTLGNATTDQGLTVTYTAADPTVVSITGNQATILKAGNTNITATQTGDNATFAATQVEHSLSVSKALLTVKADNKSKTYDGLVADNFTVTYTGFVKDETATALTGTLSFTGSAVTAVTAGLDYVVTPSGFSSDNYTITYENGKLDISKRPITLTADAKSKTYGDTDPSLTAQVTSGTIVTGDNASGSLTRATGETVADYAISQGAYTYGSNYNETFVPANLTIGKRAITLTADAKSKTYGDADPSLTAQVTSGTIVTGDNASGSLSRATGETAADYAISQGTYSYGSNYTETFVPASLTIVKRPLSVTAKIDSKTYDGTTKSSLTPIVGSLVTGDVINVVPIQLFDNANVGSNHVLTPSGLTLKNGTNNVTDNYLITYNTLSTGVITAKQLTISNPTVTINKTVDGNSSAAITNVGTLTGVETTDANNVTVAAAANYNNAAVGTGKTITVVYTLSGSAKGNYIAPANYVITNGKISDVVTLSPLLTPSPGCEGSGFNLDYSILTGTPKQYKITFDAATNSAGIQNVAYTDMPSSSTSGTLMINVPKKTIDGTYHATLVMRDELGVESPAYSFTFTINLSADYLLTKFNRIIFVDNSSKRFTAYQWYKDGVIINGATKQSYNDPAGLVGAYSVQVTDTKGNKILSCSKVLNLTKAVKVIAYPSPVKASQTCTVQVSGLSGKDLENAELSVYTPQGVCIYQSSKVELLNSLKLPSVDGVYIGQLKTADGDKHLFKVVVIK